MTRRTARTIVALLLGLVIAAHASVVSADTPPLSNAIVSTPAATPCPYWMGCSDWKLIEVNLIPSVGLSQPYMESMTPPTGPF